MGSTAGWPGDDRAGDDRARREPVPDTSADPLSFTVPDDARSLAREAEALRRERTVEARRRRVERVFKTRRWQRYGLSGPVVVLCLTVVSLVAVPLVVLIPTRGTGPSRTADVVAQAQGRAVPLAVGPGLLVDAPLVLDERVVPDRELRPAVLALVPAGCDCADAAGALSTSAAAAGVRTVFVATPESEETARALAAPLAAGAIAGVAVDRERRLAASYAARGLTAVLVRADGGVEAVLRDVQAGDRLAPALRSLPAGR